MDAQLQAVKKTQTETDIIHTDFTALFNLTSKKDETALSQVYDLSVSKVYGLALKILTNEADAEEVVCDVYTQLWHKAADFQQQRGSAISWMLVICRSRALDLLRKKHPEHPSTDINQLHQKNSEPLPEDMMNSFQEGSAVKQAMQQLSDVQRQLIALAYFKDLTHAEIAHSIQLPLGTVKSHLRRALQTLHTLIEL